MSAGDKISVREKIGYSLGDAASHIVFEALLNKSDFG